MSDLKVQLDGGILDIKITHSDYLLDDICGFANRENNKRNFLFVSKVLGKHYPVKPSLMNDIYVNLADKLNSFSINNACFIGFAETAIGLGFGVFNSWNKNKTLNNSFFIPTTRLRINHPIMFEFEEEHSHATNHLIYEPINIDNKAIFNSCNQLVLIDDEITSGNTLCNFISQYNIINTDLKEVFLVCIKNWMSIENTYKIMKLFPHLNIHFISILKGEFNYLKNDNYYINNIKSCESDKNKINTSLSKINTNFRLGLNNVNINFNHLLKDINLSKKILILGTNEFVIEPYLFAKFLEDKGCDVYFQSTTRSPILEGLCINNKLSFIDNYNENITNYIYNVSQFIYDEILICMETKSKYNFDLDEQLNAKIIYLNEKEVELC